MDDNLEKITPEEAQAEQEATAEVKDEELREKIAEDLGIDPEDESELLDKVFAREKANREKLSGAIKQKISWREKAKTTSEKKPDLKAGDTPKTLTVEEADLFFENKMAERDLESLNLTDEIKTEVKDLAKLRGISVRAAAELPYIKSRIDEVVKQQKIDDATPTRKNKSSYAPSDPSKPLRPEDFDLSTPEGREAWNNAKAARQKFRSENA